MLRFRHIFVVSYGRSGSTLLNGILDAIPGVHMRGENANILPCLCRAANAARYTRQRQSGPPHDITHPWHGAPELDAEAFRAALLRAFTENILRPPAGAAAVGFKEIRHGPGDMTDEQYDDYIRFLLEAFERPCIIFNVRNHASVMRSGFWADVQGAGAYIESSERRFRRSREQYPASTWWLDYDEYAGDPEVLRGLFDFLGASFDRAAIDRVLAIRHSY